MLYVLKIDDYLKILTDLKDFVARKFSEYFKSKRETVYSKLRVKQNLRQVAMYLSNNTWWSKNTC